MKRFKVVCLRRFSWLIVLLVFASSWALNAQSPRSIEIIQSDQTVKTINFALPTVEMKQKAPIAGVSEKYWGWAEKNDHFLLTLAQEIQGVFEKLGADAAFDLLKNYADLGLQEVNLAEALAATRAREGVVIGNKLRVALKGHQNLAAAVDFINLNLQRMNVPIEYVLAVDNSRANPFEPRADERGIVSVMEKSRYIVGPGVIALGVATGTTPLDTPLMGASALQTAYEIQFANSWMNRNVWTPFFTFTGKARKLFLGINPGVLGINVAYPVSLYEFQKFLIDQLGTDPSALKWDRPTAYTLFALGALLFTVSYGKLQDDLIVLRNTGRITEGQRYVRESIANITANALRVATVFVPIVVWKFQVSTATYDVDLGSIGLAGLGLLVAAPHAIKTVLGPRARAAYVAASMSGVRTGFKFACLSAIDRLANPYALRTH